MTKTMRAMILDAPGRPLRLAEVPIPRPGPGQALIKVRACGVCRTDLHVVDGDLLHIPAGIVPGHEIVGIIDQIGAGVSDWRVGDRVGVPWLGKACGNCVYCQENRENLCDDANFTGYTLPGGSWTKIYKFRCFISERS